MTGLNPDIRSHIQSIINSVAILRTFLYGLVDLLWWDGAVWYEMKCFGFSVTFCEYKQRQCPWLTVLSVFGLLLNVYLIPRITDYPSRRADKHIFQGFCFQSSVFWMEGFVLSLDKFHFISYHPHSSSTDQPGHKERFAKWPSYWRLIEHVSKCRDLNRSLNQEILRMS